MLEGVAVVWMPVQNIERAKGFYRNTLGLRITNEDGDWAEVDATGLTIGLNEREPSGAGATGGPVVTFQPEGSIEETISNLKEQGVEVPAEISEHPWGRVATFKDSEGNDLQHYGQPSSCPDHSWVPGAKHLVKRKMV
jgi:predicted enzyme related to lactoylglutathione lyase